MKSFICFLGALFTMCTAAFAQQEAHLGNSLLWKISGNHLEKPSYLFGTIHQICSDDYFWTDTMQKYFERAEQLCLEMDMDDTATIMQIAEGFKSDDGKTLKERFGEKDYAKIDSYLIEQKGFGLAMFDMMKPVVLLSLLGENAAACKEYTAYELQLMQKAGSTDKEIVGLESAAEQIRVLDMLSDDTVKQYIFEIMNAPEETAGLLDTLIGYYKKQDIEDLQDIINKADYSLKFSTAILDNRNKIWVDRIAKMSQQHSIFYAVGAGHLAGKDGLIYLLRKAGYAVTPLK